LRRRTRHSSHELTRRAPATDADAEILRLTGSNPGIFGLAQGGAPAVVDVSEPVVSDTSLETSYKPYADARMCEQGHLVTDSAANFCSKCGAPVEDNDSSTGQDRARRTARLLTELTWQARSSASRLWARWRATAASRSGPVPAPWRRPVPGRAATALMTAPAALPRNAPVPPLPTPADISKLAADVEGDRDPSPHATACVKHRRGASHIFVHKR
jgi:hypothetical protein